LPSAPASLSTNLMTIRSVFFLAIMRFLVSSINLSKIIKLTYKLKNYKSKLKENRDLQIQLSFPSEDSLKSEAFTLSKNLWKASLSFLVSVLLFSGSLGSSI